MLDNKKESTQPDFRLTGEKCIFLPSWWYLLWKHVSSESPVIHECNRAQILLTDAVATKLSGCICRFSTSGQSCTYHAGVYSPVLPQLLNLVHRNSDYLAQKEHIWWLLNDWGWLYITHTENPTLAEVSAMQHICQKNTLLVHTVITHLGFCCPEGSWAALLQSPLHHWLSPPG